MGDVIDTFRITPAVIESWFEKVEMRQVPVTVPNARTFNVIHAFLSSAILQPNV